MSYTVQFKIQDLDIDLMSVVDGKKDESLQVYALKNWNYEPTYFLIHYKDIKNGEPEFTMSVLPKGKGIPEILMEKAESLATVKTRFSKKKRGVFGSDDFVAAFDEKGNREIYKVMRITFK